MRVALIAPGFSQHAGDWAIPALLNLARGLAGQIDLHMFSQRYPPRGLYRFADLTHYALGGGQQFGATSAAIWLQTSRAIIRRHRQTPFDLLHAFWADEAGLSAALAGAVIRRAVVVSLGGGELTRLPHLHYGAQRFLIRRLTTRLALSRAAVITAGSAYQLNLAHRQGIDIKKLRLAPLGVDTDLFHPVNPPATSPALIQAASLLPVKNQALLLAVVQRVKQMLPNVRLHLAGDGPQLEPLQKLAQKLNLDDNIYWHGAVPHPAMAALYRQAGLVVQTSAHESQGMAVLEAMACGLPAIGTPVGVLPQVAALPPAHTADTLAAQAVALLTDRAGYAARSQQARQKVMDEYSLPVSVQNFMDIYRRVR